jgi:hypothetical protein
MIHGVIKSPHVAIAAKQHPKAVRRSRTLQILTAVYLAVWQKKTKSWNYQFLFQDHLFEEVRIFFSPQLDTSRTINPGGV